MHKNTSKRTLRSDAETKLKAAPRPKTAAPTEADLTRLVHELQVHQIELEMQNDELRNVQRELEQTRDLYDFSPFGYITLNTEGEIENVNLSGIKLLASDRQTLLGTNFQDIVANHDRDHWNHFFGSAIQKHNNEIYHLDIDLIGKDLKRFNCHIDCQYQQTVNGQSVLRAVFTDNTQLQISERENRIAAIAFESQDGMFITDPDAIVIKTNKALTEITGYTQEEAIGRKPRFLSSDQHNTEFYAAIWESIHTLESWQGEISDKRKNGELYPAKLTIRAVKDAKGKVTNYVGTLSDITLSKKAEQEIQELAFYDPLTQLPNRRVLTNRIHHAIALSTRTRYESALLFLDIDHFKDLNDTLGHDVGDTFLKQVSERLKSAVRIDDTVCRFGGDEFVLLIERLSEQPDEAAAKAKDIASKILATVNEPYQLFDHSFKTTSSIGVTLFKDAKYDENELLKQADIAMYQAKMQGRNRLCFYDPLMQQTISQRIAIENELREAIVKKQFQLHYQIQIDNSQKIVGCEALIRWKHPSRGLTYPDAFISIAEQNGSIVEIGEWLLDAACQQLAVWQQDEKTRHMTLSINVSAKELHQVDFADQVIMIVQRHNIDATMLKIELTESVLLKDIEDSIHKMNILGEVGIQFILDDFGTGYSSLQYLKELPLYELKIDQSFINDVDTNSSSQAIVRTIIAMARSLGLKVIAEGVETKEQQKRLLAEGCKLFQGFLYSKPIPIERLKELISKR